MRLNTQPVEKPSHTTDGTLEIVNIWHTLQGEGPFAGHPAVFIRLAGCNLQCPGCDTDYTSRRESINPKHLMQMLSRFSQPTVGVTGMRTPNLVVITGGEPFRQNLMPFCQMAISSGYDVQVETNGTLWEQPFFPPNRFHIVCSPKTPTIHKEIMKRANAFKYILAANAVDPTDGLPLSTLENGLRPARPTEEFTGDVYVQPMDDGAPWNAVTNIQNRAAAVHSCMTFGYKLSLQTHKLLGLE